MYWSPNLLAIVFKKQAISQQVVTGMQDLVSEFSKKNFRGDTPGPSQREGELPPPAPNTAAQVPRSQHRCWDPNLGPRNFSAVVAPLTTRYDWQFTGGRGCELRRTWFVTGKFSFVEGSGYWHSGGGKTRWSHEWRASLKYRCNNAAPCLSSLWRCRRLIFHACPLSSLRPRPRHKAEDVSTPWVSRGRRAWCYCQNHASYTRQSINSIGL